MQKLFPKARNKVNFQQSVRKSQKNDMGESVVIGDVLRDLSNTVLKNHKKLSDSIMDKSDLA